MTTQQTIENKLIDNLVLYHLEVINESHMHNVPPGSESHFKVIAVSDEFEGQRLIQRHQKINRILADELANAIHALAIQTLTQDEWTAKGGKVADSPLCLGGSKADG